MVGYHDDPDNPQNRYWRIQNSWGKDYGDGGFVKMEINPEGDGACNVNRHLMWVD